MLAIRDFVDQLSRPVSVVFPPLRIISIVPSQTELLFDLGLDREVLAVTGFCNHPADWVKAKIKVGGTKNLNIERIISLKPDLIIGNKEENDRGEIEFLMQQFPVWMSDIVNLPDAICMITAIGELVNKPNQAQLLACNIQADFASLYLPQKPVRVAYLIWKGPYMAACRDTFIDDMLQRCGLLNVFTASRYPEVTVDELYRRNPDVIMLSSEPYPFKEKHAEVLRKALPGAKIVLVDGEMFSWYGSRLLKAVAYFNNLIKILKC
ncbi:helical backbone metal receptor [Mucilaginibacter paludis]|uniref:ABC-type transporter, periplasmic subunit n=1 Tax=Mucilaginibacter paludis DSM 18603 TaxID=714943 RepID=H1YCN0_9SPHI|nr:helical backbone metal receptor [Mucilaginibacter paludis]EHQ24217.1 ABC-type transporter, periplasmic subunit [Mucilaginibacter paludis DSM 18603]